MLELRPQDLQTMNNLGWVLATSPDESIRDGQKAVRLATKVCEKTEFQMSTALDTLAAAYAACQRYSEAVATSEKAISLMQLHLDQPKIEKMRARQELYERGEAYVEP